MNNAQAYKFLTKTIVMMLDNGVIPTAKFVGDFAELVAAAPFPEIEKIQSILARPSFTVSVPNKIQAIKALRGILPVGLSEAKFLFDGTGSLEATTTQIDQINKKVREFGYVIYPGRMG